MVHSRRHTLPIALFVLFGAALLLAILSWGQTSSAKTSTWYVSPTGTNTAKSGTPTQPFKTISYALSKAKPGTTIIVLAGTYPEHIKTSVNGTASQRITLQAQGQVILTGDSSNGRVFDVWHDYYTISGFEFTGKDKLLWLQEADNTVVSDNYFHDAQGECVRVKYQSTKNQLSRNRIENCGLLDFGGGGTGKNGEGIYIGTAPEQLNRNPSPEVDQSNANVISNNTFVTNGNECVDIKEGSEQNVIEFNDCTGQKDVESAGLDARGSNNIFRYNKSYNNVGAGIRLGGDTTTDGINNDVYGNEITNNQGAAVKVMRLPQGTICGNTAVNNAGGFSNNSTITNPPCT